MYEMRWERMTGDDDPYTNNVQVILPEDSVGYRLVEALASAAAADTGNDWDFDSYCTHASGCAVALAADDPLYGLWINEIDWDRVVLAGFSHGGGYGPWLSLQTTVAGIMNIDGGNDICDDGTDYVESSYFPELVDLWNQDGGASPDDEEFAAIHENHAFIGMTGDAPLSFPYVQLSDVVQDLEINADPADVLSSNDTPSLHLFKAYVEGFCAASTGI